MVALARTKCTGCAISQYTGPDQCTGGHSESATPAPPCLVKAPAAGTPGGPRWTRSAGGTFRRVLASLELRHVNLFGTMLRIKFGGRLTTKTQEEHKRAKHMMDRSVGEYGALQHAA